MATCIRVYLHTCLRVFFIMATSEERLKILKMIEEGKINAEDGAKLLAALTDSRKSAATKAET